MSLRSPVPKAIIKMQHRSVRALGTICPHCAPHVQIQELPCLASSGYAEQRHTKWGSWRLPRPSSEALCAFYGWFSFMTQKDPRVIYCRPATLGLGFSSNLECLLHDSIIFHLFLSEAVRKFLVQAFGGDTSPQAGHLGETDKLLLWCGGWGDYLAKYHFRLWQKEISSNLSPLTFSSFHQFPECHGNDICESQGPLTVVSV